MEIIGQREEYNSRISLKSIGVIMSTMKPCPMCKKLIPYGWKYCPDCLPIAEEQREEARKRKSDLKAKKYNERYNAKRKADDPKYRQFRNSKAWKETSKFKLQSCEWKCEAGVSPYCTGLACEVHHIEPIRTEEGWNKRLEWSNLMGVCIQCHNVLDNKGFKRKDESGVVDIKKIIR